MGARTLDEKAAHIVMRARQIERALHDPGPWFMCSGIGPGYKVPARKVIGEDHVTFYAVLPLNSTQTISPTSLIDLDLICGDDLVAVKFVEALDGPAEIAWEFLVIDPEQVAA